MPAASRTLGSQPIAFSSDVGDFRRLFDKASQVDKALQRGLRRTMRQAATVAGRDVQRTVLMPPRSSGHGQHTGLRERLAAGVKVQILTGSARVGVAIVASSSALPAQQKSLLRAYGRPGGWRHPVRGNPNVWVTQIGRPGWPRTTVQAHRDQVTRAVKAAIQEATQSLEGH